MRITTKGQVTIPKEIRDDMGLLPHTEVEFIARNGKVYLVKGGKRAAGRGGGLIKKMRGKATGKMTTDQIMELTRGFS